MTTESVDSTTEVERLRAEVERLSRMMAARATEPHDARLHLDAVFELFPHILVLIGADDRFLDYRAGRPAQFLVQPEAFLGRHVTEVLPPDVAASALEALAQARTTQRLVTFEYALPAAQDTVHLEARIVPLDDGRLATLITNVTARKHAEAALRRSEAQLRAIVDTEPECVKIVGLDGRVREINRAGLIMLEADSLADVRERPLIDFVVPSHRPRFAEMQEQVLRGEASLVEFQMEGLRGTRRWLESTASALRDDAGNVTGMLAITRDITARRAAEERLRESEERFRTLIERSSDMIALIDASGTLTFVSPSVADVLGHRPEEMVGGSAFDHVHPDDVADVRQGFERTLADSHESVRMVFRARHLNGSWRELEAVTRNFVNVPAIGGVVANARDITEQRRLSRQLAMTQRLESVGRLAGGVAHDFNNLLTAILGSAELLERELPLGQGSLTDVIAIRDAALRARDLTQQLLAFARRQMIAPRVLNLNDVVFGERLVLERLCGDGITLVTQTAEALWPVKADATQLERVVLNLVVNARDAMPGGGTLTVSTANVALDAEAAGRYPGMPPGDYVALSVTDTGDGMDSETMAHVFEPFFSTKPAGRGIGLGLATVYGIVRQSGGFIWPVSAPGAGSTFTVFLPRAPQDAAPAVQRSGPHPVTHARSILLVEDDEYVRDLAARILRDSGYTVSVAASPDEALRLAGDTASAVDLLVTDVVMPGMSGRQVAARLTTANPALRVLYMSGYAKDSIVQHGVLDAGVAFLPKPFTPSALCRKVREVLGKG